jgi:hypothetical protein
MSSPSSAKDQTAKRPKSKNVDTGAPFDPHWNMFRTLSVIVEIRLRNKQKRPTENSSGSWFHVDRRPILYLGSESYGSRTTWWPWGFGCDQYTCALVHLFPDEFY